MADEFRLEDKDMKFDDLTESQAAMALRLEQFGDFALANARWGQMAETLKADAARRPWFVFARQRVHDLEPQKQLPKDAKARTEMVAGALLRSRELVKDKSVVEAQRRNARNVLRDVRDLYAGETGDLGTLVDEAKTLLEQYPG